MGGEKATEAVWIGWLRKQVELGADFEHTYAQLHQAGVSDKAIATALELVRPKNTALQDGRLAPPPLVARAPPTLRRLAADGLEAYTLDEFMSPAECDAAIALADRHLAPSPLSHYSGDPEFRTSRTCLLAHLDDPVAAAVDDKICRTLGIRAAYGEGIQAQRYEVGQQFKPHMDLFSPGSSSFLRHAGIRGNRTWTFMVYLNDGMEGGATRFTRAACSVSPRRGMALFWNNLHGDGSPNMNSEHCGEPVTRGFKFIITKWFRLLGDGPVFHD
jgi:prolyl 4-hydroxylase